MKKIYLLASILFSLAASAQIVQIKPISFDVCGTTIGTALTSTATGLNGYQAGNNHSAIGGDVVEIYQRYILDDYGLVHNVAPLDSIYAATIGYGLHQPINPLSTGSLTVKVYKAVIDAISGKVIPGSQIGNGSTKAIASLSAPPSNNSFTFNPPIALTTDTFFVSVDFTNAGPDTISLVQTQCSSFPDTYSTMLRRSSGAGFAPFTDFYYPGLPAGTTIYSEVGIYVWLRAGTVGLNELSKNDIKISAYPSPASNDLTISFDLLHNNKAEVELFDITGKQVKSVKLDNASVGENSVKLDVSNLNSGLYLYSVKAGDAKSFGKCVINK